MLRQSSQIQEPVSYQEAGSCYGWTAPKVGVAYSFMSLRGLFV